MRAKSGWKHIMYVHQRGGEPHISAEPKADTLVNTIQKPMGLGVRGGQKTQPIKVNNVEEIE